MIDKTDEAATQEKMNTSKTLGINTHSAVLLRAAALAEANEVLEFAYGSKSKAYLLADDQAPKFLDVSDAATLDHDIRVLLSRCKDFEEGGLTKAHAIRLTCHLFAVETAAAKIVRGAREQ